MCVRILAGFVAMLLSCVCVPAPGFAASDLERAIHASLTAGRLQDAAAAATSRLGQAPTDNQARFALGAVEFLQAVERLGQGFYRFGLRSVDKPVGLTGVPILRLPVPKNPAPEELTYERFRALLQSFVDDLGRAEQTLARLGEDEFQLRIDLGKIRLDLNGDGEGTSGEELWRILSTITGAGWSDTATSTVDLLQTDFDRGDASWLQAYCHLLMSIAEFPLMIEWMEAFSVTFPSIFYMPSSPYSQLKDDPRGFEGEGELAELIAFIHLGRFPVTDSSRAGRILDHLQSMVRLSRESWRYLLSETDSGREWIPNPRQSGVIPGMGITEARVAAWFSVLDEIEGIIQGTRLLPHWRFQKGMNFRRMMLELKTFDVVMLLHGADALPFVEDGTLSSTDAWVQIDRLFHGDFFRYFVWLN